MSGSTIYNNLLDVTNAYLDRKNEDPFPVNLRFITKDLELKFATHGTASFLSAAGSWIVSEHGLVFMDRVLLFSGTRRYDGSIAAMDAAMEDKAFQAVIHGDDLPVNQISSIKNSVERHVDGNIKLRDQMKLILATAQFYLEILPLVRVPLWDNATETSQRKFKDIKNEFVKTAASTAILMATSHLGTDDDDSPERSVTQSKLSEDSTNILGPIVNLSSVDEIKPRAGSLSWFQSVLDESTVKSGKFVFLRFFSERLRVQWAVAIISSVHKDGVNVDDKTQQENFEALLDVLMLRGDDPSDESIDNAKNRNLPLRVAVHLENPGEISVYESACGLESETIDASKELELQKEIKKKNLVIAQQKKRLEGVLKKLKGLKK